MTWSSVETAPLETPVLIWDGRTMCTAEKFKCGEITYWQCHGASGYDMENTFEDPAHWRVLPEPPVS